jgi:hypothetical protein
MSFPLTDHNDLILISINFKLQSGANDARSDDTVRLKNVVASWLNSRIRNTELAEEDPPTGAQVSDLLIPEEKGRRGISHDVTGRLLCPITYDWDDPTCVNCSPFFTSTFN